VHRFHAGTGEARGPGRLLLQRSARVGAQQRGGDRAGAAEREQRGDEDAAGAPDREHRDERGESDEREGAGQAGDLAALGLDRNLALGEGRRGLAPHLAAGQQHEGGTHRAAQQRERESAARGMCACARGVRFGQGCGQGCGCGCGIGADIGAGARLGTGRGFGIGIGDAVAGGAFVAGSGVR
jgi:hypothetical protein